MHRLIGGWSLGRALLRGVDHLVSGGLRPATLSADRFGKRAESSTSSTRRRSRASIRLARGEVLGGGGIDVAELGVAVGVVGRPRSP